MSFDVLSINFSSSYKTLTLIRFTSFLSLMPSHRLRQLLDAEEKSLVKAPKTKVKVQSL